MKGTPAERVPSAPTPLEPGEYVWTDYVPKAWAKAFKLQKRYRFARNAKNSDLGEIFHEGVNPIYIRLSGCAFLDGRPWNVETVPAPAPDEAARLRAAIEAEIAWHEAEAKINRDAQSLAADEGDIAGAVAHKYEAMVHEASAARLRRILNTETDHG